MCHALREEAAKTLKSLVQLGEISVPVMTKDERRRTNERFVFRPSSFVNNQN
jgi:hypothetical protein